MNRAAWLHYDTEPRSDPLRFFYAFRLAGSDLFENMWVLGGANIIAMALFIIFPLFPPALAGLFAAAADAARAEEPSYRRAWEAGKDALLRAWGLWLLNLVVYGVVLLNLAFYAQDAPPLPFFAAGRHIIIALQLFWAAVGLLWTVFWLWTAAWLAFEEPRLIAALKGALRLLAQHPTFALCFAGLLIPLLLLNAYVLPLLFFLTWAALATLAVRSVQILRHGIPELLTPEIMENLESKC